MLLGYLSTCANRSAHHGPDRFSLLYICADGVAVFRSLYIQNAIVPKAIAIIQPGHGFGGNWTNFEDHEKVLGRSVLNDNLGGGPEFLLNGGAGGRGLSNDCNCWPDYKIPQAVNDDGSNFLGNLPENCSNEDQVGRIWQVKFQSQDLPFSVLYSNPKHIRNIN